MANDSLIQKIQDISRGFSNDPRLVPRKEVIDIIRAHTPAPDVVERVASALHTAQWERKSLEEQAKAAIAAMNMGDEPKGGDVRWQAESMPEKATATHSPTETQAVASPASVIAAYGCELNRNPETCEVCPGEITDVTAIVTEILLDTQEGAKVVDSYRRLRPYLRTSESVNSAIADAKQLIGSYANIYPKTISAMKFGELLKCVWLLDSGKETMGWRCAEILAPLADNAPEPVSVSLERCAKAVGKYCNEPHHLLDKGIAKAVLDAAGVKYVE
jgi:hypothetical protein